MSYPSNWRICKLPEVVYFQEGTGLRKFQYRTSGIPFLNIRTLVNGRVNRNLCQYISTEEVEQKYKHFLLNDGDIICSTSGTLGKTAVIHAEDLPLLLNTSVMRFRSLNEEIITQKYIHLYLKSDFFINQAINASTGSAQVNVGPTHMKTFDIPVPPLNEQKRITEKLDTLFARVDSCQSHLERVPQILKRFRQSVLAAATSGRLTEDWREKQGIDYSNWENTDFDSVCNEITVGYVGTMASEYREEGIPFLRSLNVRPFRFDPKNLKFISKEFHEKISKSILHPGDVVIVRSGAPGQCCVIPKDLAEANCSDLVIARVGEKLLPEFAVVFINSEVSQSFVRSEQVGVAQQHFNVGSMKKAPLHLPSLEEQAEIVRRVEKLFAYAERLEARYTSASEHVERLTPSLLAKAFRGELVRQE
jgi:type I restriction enzyme S subunit